MTTIDLSAIAFDVDETLIPDLQVITEDEARAELANVWNEDREYLLNYLALFHLKDGRTLAEQGFFVTLIFVKHGYVSEEGNPVDVSEVRKQMVDDLNVINREAGWPKSEQIFFDAFWPAPYYDANKRQLDSGTVLRDYQHKIISKTINRFILTRYGHLELNLSIQDDELDRNRTLDFYMTLIDAITESISINEPFRYDDIDYDNDTPSKSQLIHLALSAEKF